jgi:hypothetical protein
MGTTDCTGLPHSAANSGALVSPAIGASGPERVRLRRLLEFAAEHLDETAPTTLAAISQVSSRYTRFAVYLRRKPSAFEQAGVDLACSQTHVAPADYFAGVRSAGGEA